MSNRTKTLPNHRTGVREVMLDATGKTLPVISATRVSYTDDRVTSYQRPEASGFVVRCESKDGKPAITINRYLPHLDTISPVTDDIELAKKIYDSLDEDLIAWLKDVDTKKQSNLLPAGFGWDGIMTQTEYSKYERVRDLFIANNQWSEEEQKWFDDIVYQAVKTSTCYLKLDWEDSFKLTKKIPVYRYLPDTTKVYLVTFDKDGNRSLKFVRRPIIVGGNKNVTETVTVPAGTVRAILLRTNVMVDDHTYGVSIDLYRA